MHLHGDIMCVRIKRMLPAISFGPEQKLGHKVYDNEPYIPTAKVID